LDDFDNSFINTLLYKNLLTNSVIYDHFIAVSGNIQSGKRASRAWTEAERAGRGEQDRENLPTVCKECSTLLLGDDPQPERHQVSKLPKIKPEIVE
jgi:hypothetical protein